MTLFAKDVRANTMDQGHSQLVEQPQPTLAQSGIAEYSRLTWLLGCGPIIVGSTMLILAGILALNLCSSCSHSIPPWLVAVSGLLWCSISVQRLYLGENSGALTSTTLTMAHLASLHFLNTRPCTACLAMLIIQATFTIVQLVAIFVSRHKVAVALSWAGIGIPLGVLVSALTFTLLLPPHQGRVYKLANGSGPVAILIVRRDCGNRDKVDVGCRS
jgi:hypothetical protein